MNLLTGSYLWRARGIACEPLQRDLDVEVAVVGAGITGALIADQLAELGVGCIVLDQRPPAAGSTLASTAIVQYELDVPLSSLAEKIGRPDAERAYRISAAGVETIARIAEGLPAEVGFARRPALYLCPDRTGVPNLQREIEALRQAGFQVDWMTSQDVARQYPWTAEAALYNQDAAVLDPVAFTICLLERACRRGVRIMTPARIATIRVEQGKVTLTATSGHKVHCRRAVFAGGYETARWLPRTSMMLSSSYAAATPPHQEVRGWQDECVVWETKRPYTYLRRTADGRVVIGGRDKPFRNPFLRDVLLPIEHRLLRRKARKMLNDPGVHLPLRWTGTFAESSDGMPLIGERPDWPGVLFVFGCGGNGTTFGAVARDLLPDWLAGRGNEALRLFAPDRKSSRQSTK